MRWIDERKASTSMHFCKFLSINVSSATLSQAENAFSFEKSEPFLFLGRMAYLQLRRKRFCDHTQMPSVVFMLPQERSFVKIIVKVSSALAKKRSMRENLEC